MLTAFERIEQFLTSDVFLAFAGMVLLMGLVFLALKMVQPGPAKPLRFSEKSWLNALTWFGLFLVPIIAFFFFEVLWLLFKLIAAASNQIAQAETLEATKDVRWTALAVVGLLTALGGLIGTPLAFIRVHTTERQTTAQELALFNEKMNSALSDLYSQRQITIREDGKRVSVWQDDVARRNGAIDRLEALAHERPEMAPRIARILVVYLQELASERRDDGEYA